MVPLPSSSVRLPPARHTRLQTASPSWMLLAGRPGCRGRRRRADEPRHRRRRLPSGSPEEGAISLLYGTLYPHQQRPVYVPLKEKTKLKRKHELQIYDILAN
jgi:hypothetical protein